MADLGNMANQLLMAASQLSPSPKAISKSRQENGDRDEQRGKASGPAHGGSFASNAGAERASNSGFIRRRGGGVWPTPAARDMEDDRYDPRDARGPPHMARYRNGGDNQAPAPPMRRQAYSDERSHNEERHYRERSYGQRMYSERGGVMDERGRDRRRDWDRTRSFSGGAGRSSYAEQQKQDMQNVGRGYDRFGNSIRDFDQGTVGMSRKRSSGGGVERDRGRFRSGGVAGSGSDFNDGMARDRRWRRSASGGSVHEQQPANASRNRKEGFGTGQTQRRLSGTSSGGGGGRNTPIELDNSEDDERGPRRDSLSWQGQRAPTSPRRRSPSNNSNERSAGSNGSPVPAAIDGHIPTKPLKSDAQSRPERNSMLRALESHSVAGFHCNMPIEHLPLTTEAIETTKRLEAAARQQLGPKPVDRREAKAFEDMEPKALIVCPHPTCERNRLRLSKPHWMARHLATHTLEATRQQNPNDYVRCVVAEVLDELCMDVAVPPAQRKCERRRFARALFGPPEVELGFPAGVLESKVVGKAGNPAIRRCAYEVAFGSCEGSGPPEGIVRCDICGAWTHITCGGVAVGGSCEPVMGWSTSGKKSGKTPGESEDPGPRVPVVKEEHICRICARTAAPPYGSDGPPGTFSAFAPGRKKRRQMLAFLKRDLAMKWPHGVFDLNMRVEEEDSKNRRPPCNRQGCTRASRADSRYCSDACGVLSAESQLTDALVHTLEDREGRERGQWLLENRLAKKQRTQVARAAKMAAKAELPPLGRAHEERLRLTVDRKWRLWKRLIEIGAYWEKVSGSTNLLAITNEAYATAAAAAAAARQAAIAAAARSRGVTTGTVGGVGVRAIIGASLAGNRGAAGVTSGSLGGGSGGGGGGKVPPASDGVSSSNGKGSEQPQPTDSSAAGGGSKEAAPSAEAGEGETSGAAKKASDFRAGKETRAKDRTDVKAAEPAKRAEKNGSTAKEGARKSATEVMAQDMNADTPRTEGNRSGDGKAKEQNATRASSGGKRKSARASGTTGKTQFEGGMEVDVGTEDEDTESTAAGAGENSIAGETSNGTKGKSKVPDSAKSRAARGAESRPSGISGSKSLDAEAVAAATAAKDPNSQSNTAKDPIVILDSSEQENSPAAPATREDEEPAAKQARTVAVSVAAAAAAPPPKEKQGLEGAAAEQAKQRAQAAAAKTAQEVEALRRFVNGGGGARAGVEELECAYCGDETGRQVAEHMEECYRQMVALRNVRLSSATLRPFDMEANAMLQARITSTAAGSGQGRENSVSSYRTSVARQLLERRITYADFASLPDQRRFQLHRDLQGWMGSPCRLDFLYKELIRQRNAAMAELQALDRDEALLERRIRHEWMKDGL